MSGKTEWKYCVVGNIVRERVDENGVHRYGTPAFKGGARVYLAGKDYELNREGIITFGLNRYRRYEYVYTKKEHIENVRFARVYKPKIVDSMYEDEGWNGWWDNSDEDGMDAKQFAASWPEIQKLTGAGY